MVVPVPIKREKRLSIFHHIVSAAGCMICFLHRLRKLLPGYRKHILIIKNDGIGDVFLFLPYLQKIRERYSADEWHLTVAVSAGLYPLMLRTKIADKVIVHPKYHNSFQWTVFRLWFWLTNPAADAVVNGGCVGDEVLAAYHLEKYISVYMSEPDTESNHMINVENLTVREWDQAILEHLDITEKPGEFDYTIFCDPVPAEWLRDPYILICPDASDPGRCWESSKFAALIDKLAEIFRQKIIIVGTRKDLAEEIIAQCNKEVPVVDLCGRTTLFELCTLVRNADFLVSNETGVAHMSAMLKSITYMICGKGHYGIFVPYPKPAEGNYVFSIFSKSDCKKCLWNNAVPECRQGTYRCISEITAEDVFNVIAKHVNMK